MRRIVVVGNGMAGTRLLADLCRSDQESSLTVLGAEPHAAYNRILLSDVLAGKRSPEDVGLAELPARVVQRLGSAAVAIDREARTVTAADGTRTPYDVLVLATGSEALVPPLTGLSGPDGGRVAGVHVLRTLDDCAAIVARTGSVRTAVVVGGGLLGLEAARGLLGQGLRVQIVHGPPHLMEAQLDPAGGAVLRRAVEALGVGVHLGSFASAVTGDESVSGVTLADGRHVAADLVVLACGIRPQVELARAAGLAIDRGVVVDDRLGTSDERVFALGECAQHRGSVYGLVAPAWEQAAVLADVLSGGRSRYGGSRLVTRLKALDLDVAAMGEHRPEPADTGEGLEVLTFTDPARHVYKKVVVRDGVVTGAILLGDLSTAGTVTQAFDRGTALPADRLHLLFAGLRPSAGSAGPPDDELVCLCNAVTAGQVRACARDGHRTVAAVAAQTRATTGCGSCTGSVQRLLDTFQRRAEDGPPEVPVPTQRRPQDRPEPLLEQVPSSRQGSAAD